MHSLRAAAAEFLSQGQLAVAGVSRSSDQAANLIFRTLRDRGYAVFPVNPAAAEVEGATCYAAVADIPGGVDGVVIVTPPSAAVGVVRDCIAAGVRRVWLHRGIGEGSVSPEAVEVARQAGLAVLEGGCPMMFVEHADLGHRCMRWVLEVTGRLPDGSAYEVVAER